MSIPSGSTGMRARSNMTGNKIPKGYDVGRLQQFTPESMQLYQEMFGHVSPESRTSRLAAGDPQMFEQLEAPALRQFNEVQGNIASRFSGMGTGSRRSSGFANTMNQASSDFAQQLQSQRLGLSQQATRDLMEMANMLMSQRPYEQFVTEKKVPGWQRFLESLAGGIGGMAGNVGSMYAGKKLGIF